MKLPKSVSLKLIVSFALLFSGQAFAKDLYVSSTNGDDSLSYDQVSESNPWRTINQAVYNVRAGDTIHIRGGTYTPDYTMYTLSDFTSKNSGGHPTLDMNAQSGTASNRVTIRGYEGETAVIDLSNAGGMFISLDGKHYWTFENLQLINAWRAFWLGWDAPSTNHVFRNLQIQGNRGGDNVGLITMEAAAQEITIENNVLTGPGIGSGVHLNTASLYLTRTNQVTIRNNVMHNAPIGIYFKHLNIPQNSDRSDVDILIENNFFYDQNRRSMEFNAVGAVVRNNIFGRNNQGIKNSEANGGAGGDFNRFEYNTFYENSLLLSADANGSDSYPGSNNNVVYGNVFVEPLRVHEWSSRAHNTDSDYNVFASILSHRNNSATLSLDQWQSATNEDLNSVYGNFQFVGGDLTQPAAYALTPSSVGVGLIGGRTPGADASIVGIQGELPPIGEPSDPPVDEEPPAEEPTDPGEEPDTETPAGSECANMQPGWVFCDDFETGNFSKWTDVNIITMNSATANTLNSNYSAQMNYTTGSQDGGWMWHKNARPDSTQSTTVYLRWWQKWEADFEWNEAPGGDQKLMMLQALSPRDGWEQNASQWRIYLHTVGLERASQGIATNELHIDHILRTGASQWEGTWTGMDQNISKQLYRRDVWECTEIEVVEGTPGNANGSIRYWINDQLVGEHSNIELRDDGTSINALQVNAWFGDGAPKSQNSWIDNVVLSSSRIGCGSSASSPALPPSNLSIRRLN